MKKLYWINYHAIAIFSLSALLGKISPVSAQQIPKAECRSDYGQVACGYNCIADYGKVRCADWPGGVCKADYGQVVCGPAAPPNWTLGYTSSQGTANPPKTAWKITKHNMSLQECQERVYQAMQTASFINITTGGNSNLGYILKGNINNNTTTIACQNGSVFLVVAGSNSKTVIGLRDSIYQNMGFGVNH